MTQPPAIPMTVIGGFLGSGKTTLINRLLTNTASARYAVLVNDFGALNIDADLITADNGDVIELANGCVCCTIGDSLIETLFALFEREVWPDRIVIEASGVADPARIAEMAELDGRLRRDGVVVLVDAMRFLRQRDDDRLCDTLDRQIASADVFLVSKGDEAGEALTGKARQYLAHERSDVPILSAVSGDVPAELLFDMNRPTGSKEADGGRPDHPFWSLSFELEGDMNRADLDAFFEDIADEAIRAKGVFRLRGGAGPHVYQMADGSWDLRPAPVRSGLTTNRLVLIGTGEAPRAEDIEARLRACVMPIENNG